MNLQKRLLIILSKPLERDFLVTRGLLFLRTYLYRTAKELYAHTQMAFPSQRVDPDETCSQWREDVTDDNRMLIKVSTKHLKSIDR